MFAAIITLIETVMVMNTVGLLAYERAKPAIKKITMCMTVKMCEKLSGVDN